MYDPESLTTSIAANLVLLAEALAPHVADLADDDAREALVQRLDEVLTPEWHVLDDADALDSLSYGTAMAIFGVDRLVAPR